MEQVLEAIRFAFKAALGTIVTLVLIVIGLVVYIVVK